MLRPPTILARLRALQHRRGFLPSDELASLAEEIGEPLHRVHELVSFFPHFRRAPGPPVVISVCRDLACHHRGAGACFEAMEAEASAIGSGRVGVEWVSCLGRCDRAPAAIAAVHSDRETSQHHGDLARLTPARAAGEVRAWATGAGHSDPPSAPPDWRIDAYAESAEPVAPVIDATPAEGSYRAARGLALARETGVERLLAALKEAELRGMGGAGVPAFRKWQDVRDARGDAKFVICNADESEPCTFKDREILRHAPHLVVEGMVLGALIVGAEHGYVYIRHEYPDQIALMERAIAEARALGVVGPNVLGTGQGFELEVFESPGGYVCGEQSALIEAMEGHRSEPRNKPPQIETNGLFDRPTLLNNVETFAWVPAIALRGGGWYAGAGVKETPWYVRRKKAGARGLRLFSLCGDVERPGVFELPIGATLGELIDRAGGMLGGRALKAVAPSGPSGGFIPAYFRREDLAPEFRRGFPEGMERLDVRDLPLDLDEFRTLGLMLGAGLMVVAEGPGADVWGLALNATRFYRNESCGKCVPCRVGSQKLVEIGEGLAEGAVTAGDRSLIDELSRALELTSICGLGQSAAKPLTSALQYFVPERVVEEARTTS